MFTGIKVVAKRAFHAPSIVELVTPQVRDYLSANYALIIVVEGVPWIAPGTSASIRIKASTGVRDLLTKFVRVEVESYGALLAGSVISQLVAVS